MTAIVDRVEGQLRRRGIEAYEICFTSSGNLSIEVSEGKVENFKSAAPAGVSLRILKEGGMGFSFSTSLEEGPLQTMVENALVGAQTQSPDPDHAFPPFEGCANVGCMYDEELPAVPEEEKIAIAMELERLTLAADPRIRKTRKASYGESVREVHIRNSNGIDVSCRSSLVTASVAALAEQEGDSQLGWDFGYSTTFRGLSLEDVARGAARRGAGLLGGKKIPTMNCPIVLDNYVAAEILEVLAPSFLAENIHKGKSLLRGRLGETLFSPLLRIRDDGTYPAGLAVFPFDGEGVCSRDTAVVERGTVTSFLYDTLYARKAGTVSTGNSTRDSIKGPPRMGVTNFFIEPGQRSVAELIREVDRGILLTEVMGMHTANPISGDFSVGAAGYLVERGAIAHPVREIAVSGNIVKLFSDVAGVASDLRFFGAVGAPSLLVSSLDVSGH